MGGSNRTGAAVWIGLNKTELILLGTGVVIVILVLFLAGYCLCHKNPKSVANSGAVAIPSPASAVPPLPVIESQSSVQCDHVGIHLKIDQQFTPIGRSKIVTVHCDNAAGCQTQTEGLEQNINTSKD